MDAPDLEIVARRVAEAAHLANDRILSPDTAALLAIAEGVLALNRRLDVRNRLDLLERMDILERQTRARPSFWRGLCSRITGGA